jgi:thiol-disulfide isomerase/thioredoxin
MTTADPTPGNSEQKAEKKAGLRQNLASVLLPAAAIVLLVTGGLWMVRVWIAPTAVNVSGSAEGTGISPATGPAEMRVGAVLPDFVLRDFHSEKDLSVSQLKAKVMLVNFWATWCEACMVEMPSIVKVHQAYKDRGFDVVAINLDSNPAAVVPRTIKKYEMGFAVYLDVDSRLADLFDIQSIPLTVVIDANRKILMIEREGIDWNGPGFRSNLEKWLEG